MQPILLRFGLAVSLGIAGTGCQYQAATQQSASSRPTRSLTAQTPSDATANLSGKTAAGEWLGFDRNDYPGDANMAAMHSTFAFTGYWLNNPPGETANTWTGKRALLRAQGWGFLLLVNGRLDAEILKAGKTGVAPAEFGRRDAALAVRSARHENFPVHAILFLDQEEGGRLLPEQASYLLGWTEAVAATGFRPGVYASGQPVEDGPGVRIDTIQDIRAHVKADKLHEIAFFDALDQCPPAPGCTVAAPALHAALDPDLLAWQFAQSPRRPELTKSCAATYARDGNCYAPGFSKIFLDMNVARTPDPSEGR